MTARGVPGKLARRIRRHNAAWPPVGWVRLGSLRRVTPISDNFGFDRGLPIDRHYIETFLSEHAAGGDIRGRVLEVREDLYATRLGGPSAIDKVDVVDIDVDNPRATITGDLAQAEALPAEAFDCIICTQTLPYIYDIRAALTTLHRALKGGGVLLVTVPGISRTSTDEGVADQWHFTSNSARRAFEDLFPASAVTVQPYGNVLSAAAFLYGLAASELRAPELAVYDDRYEVVIGIRAVKPSGTPSAHARTRGV